MREMKDSGVEWIGEIPKTWEIIKLKNICHGFSNGSSLPQLTSGISDYPVSRIETISNGKINMEKVGYVERIEDKYLLKQNDFLVSNINSIKYLGNCAKVTDEKLYHGMNLLRIIPSNVNPDFLYYYLKSVCFITPMQVFCKPAINQASVSSFQIKQIPFPTPRIQEQAIIASFLDAKCAEIDSISEDIRKEIETLQEYRKSVITEAVTKGLDPDVEMKDSENQFLGTVNASWNEIKIKHIFSIRKEIAGYEGPTVLSITQKGIKPKSLKNGEGQQAENYSGYQFISVGDFAMNHMDLLTGWVDISKYDGVTSPDYRVFQLNDTKNNVPEYYLYLLQTCYSNRIFYRLGRGVSGMGRWRLPADQFMSFIVPKPSKDEQLKIVAFLNSKCAEIDSIIADKQKQLDTLAEYRKSLIYEYVTGKKEVPTT